jgi:hypothetical protein
VLTDDEPRVLPVLLALATMLYVAVWLLAGPPTDEQSIQALSGAGDPAASSSPR